MAIWSYPGESHFYALEEDPVMLNTLGDLRTGVFVMKPFLPEEPYIVLPTRNKQQLAESESWLKHRLPQIADTLPQRHLPDYEGLVAQGREHIRQSSNLEKLVLSRFDDVPTGMLAPSLLDELKSKYPNAFVCFFSNQESGTWIMASPELFLSCKDSVLASFSMAGTQIEEQQEIGAKEHHEQRIVTEYITDVFAKAGLKPIVKGGTYQNSGDLKHILNRVEAAVTDSLNLPDLINALHPTPAVGGSPKHAALDFLAENEGYNRNMYAGFVGEMMSPHDFSFYVNLRCCQLAQNTWRFYAGAGITKDSIPSMEYAETKAKMEVLKSVLLKERA